MALAAAWPPWTAVIGCGAALVLLGLVFISPESRSGEVEISGGTNGWLGEGFTFG